MPPPKSSRNTTDDKTDSKDKDKGGTMNGAQSGTKMRRVASQAGTHARDQTAAAVAAASQNTTAAKEAPTIQWHTLDRKILHAYRREYNLDTPLSFEDSYHHITFTRPGGIGIYSPTMARRRKQRRQTKEQLALAVRKHFNGMGVQENDVIVDLLHSVHNREPKVLRFKVDDSSSLVESQR